MNSKTGRAIVIGSGPAGEGAAMHLAKSGWRVQVCERHGKVGGGCTHWGTIPSKALRFAIWQLTEALQHPMLRNCAVNVDFTVADLTARTRSIVAGQVEGYRRHFEKNGIEVIYGPARLLDKNTVIAGADRRLEGDAIVLAPGSRPYRPAEVDFTHPRIFDSDKILGLSFKPGSMAVYGAGVIGCEYASMFRFLDIKIDLINSRDRLLDFLDDEISDALSYHMRENGIVIRHNEAIEKIVPGDHQVELHLKSGKRIRSDILLWAAGRTGNSDNLGLENVGLIADSRGNIAVDENYQTTVKGIYATGDVVGFPSLASAAYTQGRIAAMHIVGDTSQIGGMGRVPSGIYTNPEISSIGQTERELTAAKIPYEVGAARFKNVAKAQITGQETGMLKILFHRDTLEILGIHCFGANASEIVHIGQAVMENGKEANSLKYFLRTTFNYPTMAEAYRIAALNGFNRVVRGGQAEPG
jgi:NAD(P) transhydrogenase